MGFRGSYSGILSAILADKVTIQKQGTLSIGWLLGYQGMESGEHLVDGSSPVLRLMPEVSQKLLRVQGLRVHGFKGLRINLKPETLNPEP